MPLSFPSNFRYFDDKLDAITVPARDSETGHRVAVRVTLDLLTGYCGASDHELITLFASYDRHRAQLQARASRAFDQGRLERDGGITLTVERDGDRPAPPPQQGPDRQTPRRGFGRLFASRRQ
jgi:Protein of unknown function (DUF1488)